MREQPSPGQGQDRNSAAATSGRLGRRKRADRLAGIERLIVDGTNVSHALGNERGPLPPAALIGRLRTVVPANVAIDLVFDGPPAPGLGRRIGPGLRVHHAADRPADDLIVSLLIEAARTEHPPSERGRDTGHRSGSRLEPIGRPRALVVTDDVELARRVGRRGAATAPVRWLLARLARPTLAAPAAGRRRPPPEFAATVVPRSVATGAEPPDPEPWRPGRGATKKRGNPRRRPRRAD